MISNVVFERDERESRRARRPQRFVAERFDRRQILRVDGVLPAREHPPNPQAERDRGRGPFRRKHRAWE